MKKLYILWILSILSVQQIFAQEEYTLTTKNGDKKTIIWEHDPTKLPRFNIDIKFFGLVFFGNTTEPDFSFRLTPTYRLNEKITLDAHVTLPYPPFEGSRPEYVKPMRDISIMGHYILASSQTTKDRTIEVDRRIEGNVHHVTTTKLPRSRQHNLSGDAGFINYRTFLGIGMTSQTAGVEYRLNNITNTGLNLGISYYSTTGYKLTVNDDSYTHWGSSRFYGQLTIGLANNYDVIKSVKTGPNFEDKIITPTTSGFEKPKSNPIGYRVGFEAYKGGIKNGGSLTLGIEYGMLPGIKLETGAQSIFLFHFGFGLASKPTEL